MASDAFAKALYGEHPYARKVRGTVPTIERFVARISCAFTRRVSTRRCLTIVVVGDIVEEFALAAIAKLFGSWNSASAKASAGQAEVVKMPDPPLAAERRLVSVPMMNKSQADVVYGFVGIARTDPRLLRVSR